MRELYSSGVSYPFDCAYAARVKDPDKVEQALHIAFAPQRLNPKREFFKIDHGQAIPIIRLLEIQNATIQVTEEAHNVDPESTKAAEEQLKKRRPALNFREMNILSGSELHSNITGEDAIVIGEKLIRFRNEEMSLTAATRLCLTIDYSVAPGPYWTFNGKSIREIYNETYPFEQE